MDRQRQLPDTDRVTEPIQICEDDLSSPDVRALVALHVAGMHATSPPGASFALPLAGLIAPEVTVWTAWFGRALAGMAALKQLDAHTGELKAMRTHPQFLRRRVASVLLEHIIAAARSRSLVRLSLETGRGAEFEPALQLYRRRGFLEGPAFGEYRDNGFSKFLHLDL